MHNKINPKEQGASRAGRPTTVLFAGLTTDEEPSKTAHAPAEAKAIARCLEALSQAAELSGGRLVKRRDNEVMALFRTPDAAAAAAARMHVYAETLPRAPQQLGVRIGFHTGPVAQRNDDIFGDTVNLALQLVDEAKKGQILTSEHTVSGLSPAVRDSVRPLHRIQVKGKDSPLLLGELVWRKSAKGSVPPLSIASPTTTHAVLHLTYRGNRVQRRREGDSVTMGRDPNCELFIADPTASRQHCTIERREEKFILRDHSTNGTFVTVDRESEVRLQAEEFTLLRRGWIAFGQSRALTSEVVQYICEYA
jgi:class 3 adenylate cyclase